LVSSFHSNAHTHFLPFHPAPVRSNIGQRTESRDRRPDPSIDLTSSTETWIRLLSSVCVSRGFVPFFLNSPRRIRSGLRGFVGRRDIKLSVQYTHKARCRLLSAQRFRIICR
jgi:hypothetical protein